MYHCNETIKSDKDQNDIALKAQLICYFSSFEDRTTTKMILFFLLLILLSTEANLIRIVRLLVDTKRDHPVLYLLCIQFLLL